jgi:hypothetical protein
MKARSRKRVILSEAKDLPFLNSMNRNGRKGTIKMCCCLCCIRANQPASAKSAIKLLPLSTSTKDARLLIPCPADPSGRRSYDLRSSKIPSMLPSLSWNAVSHSLWSGISAIMWGSPMNFTPFARRSRCVPSMSSTKK